MNYRKEWLNTLYGPAPDETITVYFRDGREPAVYSLSMLNLLKDDHLIECITSDETGEILYDRGL